MKLPSRVRVVEVGPRDGFQAETKRLPTELKVEIIDRLADSGLPEIEAASFVHPRVIPQMADAADVMRSITRRPNVTYSALVPNLRGAERALECGVGSLRMVICVTETYNRQNVGLDVAQSVETFATIVERASATGVSVSAVLGVTFGCPFEGEVAPARVEKLARQLTDRGSAAIGLADSAGLAHPVQVGEVVGRIRAALPNQPLWLHLHDTRGLGLANALAGMQQGVDTLDTSLGGLGGCPVMEGATGNIATEDLVNLCAEMGVETGVDLDGVRTASRTLATFLGRALPSRVLAAGTREELYARSTAAD